MQTQKKVIFISAKITQSFQETAWDLLQKNEGVKLRKSNTQESSKNVFNPGEPSTQATVFFYEEWCKCDKAGWDKPPQGVNHQGLKPINQISAEAFYLEM